MRSSAILGLAAVIAACGSPVQAATRVTYAEHIAPIVHAKCSGCHHPGQAGPFSLLTFEDVSKRSETIAAVVGEGYMPPWPPADGHVPLAHDRRLSAEQKTQLLAWIADGCPAGDLAKAPAPPAFPDGWLLGPPDLVVTMEGEYHVPADGPDIYRNFVLPLDLPEDKWVKAIELQPQARSAVHHALYFVVDSDAARERDAADPEVGFRGMGVPIKERIGGYVPGAVPQPLPEDLAYPLAAGTDLVLQTHFHPSGKRETEQLTVGLYFADKPPTRELLSIQVPPGFGRGAGIDIPAGESNYVVTDHYTLPAAVDGYLVSGHAHYICARMNMVALLPTGEERTLLAIDDWNLDWQGEYGFQSPVHLPAGTELTTTLTYNNSDENLRNPFSPPQRVRWGEQSTDEMGSITLLAVASDAADVRTLKNSYRAKSLEVAKNLINRNEGRERLREEIRKQFGSLDEALFTRLDANRDGELERSEVPEASRKRAFSIFDHDEDGRISQDEIEAIMGARPAAAAGNETPAGKNVREEIAKRLRESDGTIFNLMDKNSDGKLLESEVAERFRGRVFQRFDADGDGEVSRQEFDAQHSAAKKGAE
jgi:Ca2+-binding EF-hand superfamily protein